ncbi:DUF2948 family protein [Aurantimonas sp. Leaf443]|uniref:DUF2948 family protein n=1 Tax=Aurantimonas sp. Leaf443 TaxID=1736378 RepID=UPI0006F34A72|nr:DUF2948 family protein [Aurantimonas sp. Leaf443]KQT87908.1 hypothetical protein ASG48_00085 [Aurantimonas sp. Leaf443]
MPTDHLRLLAVDEDDLAILSAHCQDAVVKPAQCRFDARRGQFVLEMNRFVWETAAGVSKFRLFSKAQYERRLAALHFDRVTGVKRIGVSGAPDEVLVLLAIRFTAGEAPSGAIELVFAGGAAIRLDVEVIEAQLSDLGGAWSTTARPDHERADLAS